jgi:phospholipid N-methyltransferase
MGDKRRIIIKKTKDGLDKLDKLISKQFDSKDFDEFLKKCKPSNWNIFSYIKRFAKDPCVAAFHPSSKYVVNRVIRAMNLKSSKVVVEFGAAEGVITDRIIKNLSPDGKLFAIERNKQFYNTLCKLQDERIVPINSDVRNYEDLLDEFDIPEVDCVVSGVPFSFFTPVEREKLLKNIYDSLNPNGRFVAYQFTTHLIPLLKKQFPKMDVEFEVRNFPPHFVFTATKK